MFLNLKMQKYCLCVFLVLIYNANAQDTTSTSTETSTLPNEVFLNNDESRKWTSEKYPDPYPPESQELTIETDFGYSILVTIDSLDLDSLNGDYLVIKPGTSLESQEGKGKIFTYNLKSERKYLVHSNKVYLRLEVYGNKGGKKGFSLNYQRVGEAITTTTVIPTTGVTWPTPSTSDSIYYTAFIAGKTQEDFNDTQTLLNLKTALAEMATEYCDTNNFVLTDKITEQNVHMYYLIQCSNTWPNYETCVKARFALPVLVEQNSTWSGYQLSTAHLEQMWVRLSPNYLQKYGMDVYSVPDNRSSFIKWIIISCIVLILFLILLYFVKVVIRRFAPTNHGKRRLSDTGGFMSSGNKTSNVSLAPHPYQTTPAFFDNDYTFDQFEVDIGLPKKTAYTDYTYPLSEDDSDNDIIFSNFSNSRNNIEKENKETDS